MMLRWAWAWAQDIRGMIGGVTVFGLVVMSILYFLGHVLAWVL